MAPERLHADLFTRQPAGPWLLTAACSASDVIDLDSIGCRLALRDAYEGVEFTAC
jgi:hypothetical protein